MSEDDKVSNRENAEVKLIEANTLHRLEEVKGLRDDARLKKLGFCFRWLIIWLTVGGFIKLEVVQEVAKWISG